METLTLSELNGRVRSTLQYTMPDTYWVQAEISSLSPSGSGHCYLELVQKDETGRKFLAKAKANIWKGIWMNLRPKFERATGERLAVGMKVLLAVKVSFHEEYGYSLVVNDIDPTYTMGDMARRRREIIERLKADGVIDQNRGLPLPVPMQRIAVVSSATAAGYGDFMNQLDSNIYGFRFSCRLFPAMMQGNDVESSVISALNVIAAQRDSWDVVVIIRGGGAVSELSCFDSYDLASNIANFPLPVITGIGHDRDDTVADTVAFMKVKTPTAAAEYIISKMYDTAMELENLARRLGTSVQERMNAQKQRITLLSQKLPSLFAVLKVRQEQVLERAGTRVGNAVANLMTARLHRLELLEKGIAAADPATVLKRGYSMTLCNGHALKSASDLKPGDRLVTVLADGKVESEII